MITLRDLSVKSKCFQADFFNQHLHLRIIFHRHECKSSTSGVRSKIFKLLCHYGYVGETSFKQVIGREKTNNSSANNCDGRRLLQVTWMGWSEKKL